ncbi:hypothetical protein BDZ91DRAFT_80075 [Kalaharituber pfeilii]|nr:hypothetical protein BDZ91DRAFT_80075 [Kalaharituber pfeilii]
MVLKKNGMPAICHRCKSILIGPDSNVCTSCSVRYCSLCNGGVYIIDPTTKVEAKKCSSCGDSSDEETADTRTSQKPFLRTNRHKHAESKRHAEDLLLKKHQAETGSENQVHPSTAPRSSNKQDGAPVQPKKLSRGVARAFVTRKKPTNIDVEYSSDDAAVHDPDDDLEFWEGTEDEEQVIKPKKKNVAKRKRASSPFNVRFSGQKQGPAQPVKPVTEPISIYTERVPKSIFIETEESRKTKQRVERYHDGATKRKVGNTESLSKLGHPLHVKNSESLNRIQKISVPIKHSRDRKESRNVCKRNTLCVRTRPFNTSNRSTIAKCSPKSKLIPNAHFSAKETFIAVAAGPRLTQSTRSTMRTLGCNMSPCSQAKPTLEINSHPKSPFIEPKTSVYQQWRLHQSPAIETESGRMYYIID